MCPELTWVEPPEELRACMDAYCTSQRERHGRLHRRPLVIHVAGGAMLLSCASFVPLHAEVGWIVMDPDWTLCWLTLQSLPRPRMTGSSGAFSARHDS
ncbi:hypothetical protein OH77DRAFT_167921 [Trametes cingulata]|nr:hypothetical protein OH77DRAFT_167921 [Trametes cingulata]